MGRVCRWLDFLRTPSRFPLGKVSAARREPGGPRTGCLGGLATVRNNDGSITEAVAYYGEYRDEIDAEIALNEAEYERGRAAAAAGEQALRE